MRLYLHIVTFLIIKCTTQVVERRLSQSLILKSIQDKNTAVCKDFFDGFQRWNDGLLRGIKISVVAFLQGEIDIWPQSY